MLNNHMLNDHVLIRRPIIIALVLTLIAMCMPIIGPIHATNHYEASYTIEATKLQALGIFKGNTSGFELERAPTRLEGLIMLLRLMGKEDDALASPPTKGGHPFKDVPPWANAYVAYAYAHKLTYGLSTTLFGSDDPILASAYCTLFLRALGYNDTAGDFEYSKAIDFAIKLGIVKPENESDLKQKVFLRDHLAKLTFDVLRANLKNSEVTLAQSLVEQGLFSQSTATSIGILMDPQISAELKAISEYWPMIWKYYQAGSFDLLEVDAHKGQRMLYFSKFNSFLDQNNLTTAYFTWYVGENYTLAEDIKKDYPYMLSYTAVDAGGKYRRQIGQVASVAYAKEGTLLLPGPSQSKIIADVELMQQKPIVLRSSGDLWFTTWTSSQDLISTWGDGTGFADSPITDLGVAVLTGELPSISGTNLYFDKNTDVFKNMEKLPYESWNDKPSSLLEIDGKLYMHIHRPLGQPSVGYLAVSEDLGRTWTRFMETSPWTKERGTHFACGMMLNMGQGYSENKDGYVYLYGINHEWSANGNVYLARVAKANLLNYKAYEYYSHQMGYSPLWTKDEKSATPLKDLYAYEQFSCMYHPGIGRYLLLTEKFLYEAPQPWGPWAIAGQWLEAGWYGYQPGLISKGTAKDSFWFTLSGQPDLGWDVPYQLCLGQMKLVLY